MNKSHVISIESLEDLNQAILRFMEDLRQTLEELKAARHRADEAFSQQYPAYWRKETRLAERQLNEAKDQLSAKTSTARPDDQPAASEEKKRLRRAETRLRICNEKLRRSKEWSLKISRECDQLLGPLTDVLDQCDSVLPVAATELRALIGHLKDYTDQNASD